MKALFLALLFLPVAGWGAAATKPERPAQVRMFGRDYVGVASWAKANNLTVERNVSAKGLILRNSRHQLLFLVDSRRMEMNGVSVWLSHSIVFSNSTTYIALRDLQTVLLPVVFPERYASSRKLRTICLDAGHGGRDPGNEEGRYQEKKYTLLLAAELKAMLEKAGFKVTLTRAADTYLEPRARPVIANERQADLFISLHYNSAERSGSGTIRGAEVYCLTPVGASSTNGRGGGDEDVALPGNANDSRNIQIAYQLHRSLVKNLSLADRGLRRARFAVLTDATMPAVLVEAGFMSEPSELKRIVDPAFRKRTARAIVDGILAWKKSVGA